MFRGISSRFSPGCMTFVGEKVKGERTIARFIAEPEESGLLELLIYSLPEFSRSRLKKCLHNGTVRVNGRQTTSFDARVRKGAMVEIVRSSDRRAEESPWYKIAYEDRWLMVVNKEPGILSMQVGNKGECLKSLIDLYLMRHHRKERVHVVHRLDRETSGLMVFAKSVEVQQQLIAEWKQRVRERSYVAVVEGRLRPANGTLTSWLWQDANFLMHSSTKPTTDGKSQLATTHYKTIQTGGRYSMVKLELETGRKNQIRVQLAAMKGTPVVGDRRYGLCKEEGDKADPIGRLALHAHSISFAHPVTEKVLRFETPIPNAFVELMGSKEGRSGGTPTAQKE